MAMTEEEFSKRAMSVIVPVFNREALVERSLDSVYAQTWRPLHLIVVDNGSSDASARRVLEWAARHRSEDFTIEILTESRRGAAYARQAGLDRVKTRHVMHFDSDDVMNPLSAATAMEVFLSRPQTDIVAWPVVFHREGGDVVSHRVRGNIMEMNLIHGVLRTQGYAVKTSFLRRAGGWRGGFPNWNDFETGVRLMLNAPAIVSVDTPMAEVFPQKESITGFDYSSKAGKWELSLDAVGGYIASAPDNAVVQAAGIRNPLRARRRLLNLVAYRRAILAALYAREGRSDLGAPLLQKALEGAPSSKRPALRLAYLWTRVGLRGAFSLMGRLL